MKNCWDLWHHQYKIDWQGHKIYSLEAENQKITTAFRLQPVCRS